MRVRKSMALLGLAALLAAGCGKSAQTGDVSVSGAEDRDEPASYQAAELSAETEEKLDGRLLEASLDALGAMDSTGVYSHVSAYLAFAALGNGMNEEEQESLRALLLADGVEYEEVNAYCAKMIERLRGAKELTLDTNMLAAYREGYELKPEFEEILTEGYRGETMAVNFEKGRAWEELNGWISDRTNGMIPEFFTEPYPTDNIFHLLNTIYLKGKWELPIDRAATHEQTFHGNGGDTTAEMMSLSETMRYAENESFQAIALSYQGGEAELQIYLPRKGHGVQETAELLKGGLPEFSEEYGTAEFPKFTAESTWDLLELSEELGYGDLRDQSLTELLIGKNGVISSASQKAKIIVDEEGTEAAAVSDIAVEESGVEVCGEFTFCADRPFFYLLMFDGLPVFVGTVMDIA